MVIDLPNPMNLRAGFQAVRARAKYLNETPESLRKALQVLLQEMLAGRSTAASVALANSVFKRSTPDLGSLTLESIMTDKITTPLPEPAFHLKWRDGAYYVSEPNIGNTDCYTTEQVIAYADADTKALRKRAEEAEAALSAIRARTDETVKTNARLIEAAPELLDALIDLLLDTQHSDHNCPDEHCPVAKAKRAISQATGEHDPASS